MSGHSKWSTIKHKKGVADAKRGKVFSKVSKNIYLAVKKGNSGDANTNPFLRQALDEARSVNMPSDNVRRAIDRALGAGEGGSAQETLYEGYGPGGVGITVLTATNNRNRTGGEVKSIFDKHGGSLGGTRSVSYMKSIDPVPMILLAEPEFGRAKILLNLLEEHDDVVEVWSNLKKDE